MKWLRCWREDGLERDAGKEREERAKNVYQPNIRGLNGGLEDVAKAKV